MDDIISLGLRTGLGNDRLRPDDVKRLCKLPLALGVTTANMLLDINLNDAALGDKGAWLIRSDN